jgi:hypothetical protein
MSREELHELGVVTQAGKPGDSVSFAWCSCGWEGPTRKWRDEATEDALNHPEPEPDQMLAYLHAGGDR